MNINAVHTKVFFLKLHKSSQAKKLAALQILTKKKKSCRCFFFIQIFSFHFIPEFSNDNICIKVIRNPVT